MNRIFDEIEKMRIHFGWDKTDTIDFVTQCIVDEAHELNEAVHQNDRQAMQHELADVLMYALTLSKLLDVDVETIIKEKVDIVLKRNYD